MGNHDQFGLNDELFFPYNIKKDPAIGIDPDYDQISHKSFDAEGLIRKLNTESYDKKKFYILHSEEWRWQIDTVVHKPSGYVLWFDDRNIGLLELDDSEENTGLFVNMIPSMTCTVYEIKYIRECTGWKIEV